MPDTRIAHNPTRLQQGLRDTVPPALMVLGAISLLRTSRFLSLVAVGLWLYDAVASSEDHRKHHGRDKRSRHAATERLDDMIDDSFPASDPPSHSGATAGAP
jgi:hypothetical protein